MAGTEMKNVVLIALVVLVIVFVLYQYDSSLCGLLNTYQGFENPKDKAKPEDEEMAEEMQGKKKGTDADMDDRVERFATMKDAGGNSTKKPAAANGAKPMAAAKVAEKSTQGFADLSSYEGPANFGAAEAPAGCYPRDQITPSELLPKDMNSIWAEQNPMGPGSLKGKNFLSAGALIGVNTVGQSLRNANLQLRSEPPNPQVPVSIFLQSTIAPDISHRPLEIGA
jgi:hypothetical protein